MADEIILANVTRSHASSNAQKTVFWGLHFLIIVFCGWLVLFDGSRLAIWLGKAGGSPIPHAQ